MSTGAECRFTEVEPGRYSYWLQAWPYGETDAGATYGPFPSFARAYAHLHEHHANPGGHSTRVLTDGRHLHEWVTGPGQGPVGMAVKVSVTALGPDPSRADVLAYLRALPDESPEWRTWTEYGTVANQTRCEACGALEGETVR